MNKKLDEPVPLSGSHSRNLLQRLRENTSENKTEISFEENKNSKEPKIKSYSKLLPKNANTPKMGAQRLDIIISSTKQDNPELLHFLLQKTTQYEL